MPLVCVMLGSSIKRDGYRKREREKKGDVDVFKPVPNSAKQEKQEEQKCKSSSAASFLLSSLPPCVAQRETGQFRGTEREREREGET